MDEATRRLLRRISTLEDALRPFCEAYTVEQLHLRVTETQLARARTALKSTNHEVSKKALQRKLLAERLQSLTPKIPIEERNAVKR